MRCLLALGSNLGDRAAILAQACAEVAKLPNCQLLARSRWHVTVPIGGAAGQGEYLNGAILLETALPAQQLATALQQTETRLGRQRVVRWDARTLDIDMLLYGQEAVATDALTVPHARMTFRKFVLEPASEIAGPMLHPTSGWTVARLLAHLQNSTRYVVVTAPEKPIADWLVSQLSQKMSCPVVSSSEENSAMAGVLQTDRGIESPERSCGNLPALASVSPKKFDAFEAQKNCLIPALVIAVDVTDPKNLCEVASLAGFVATHQEGNPTAPKGWLNPLGLGPLARITSDDPTTVLQEAEAALRCIWPEIS